MPNWKSIIIHHSATDDDGTKDDWEGIRRFHMSWRLNGETISPEDGRKLHAVGKPVIRPWRDIGYHWGIESVKGSLAFHQGRPLDKAGAHCEGMNSEAIGICCVGDFDKYRPSDAVYYNCAMLCQSMIEMFPKITPWDIFPHSKFAHKSCPGAMFDMDRLVRYVKVMRGGN